MAPVDFALVGPMAVFAGSGPPALYVANDLTHPGGFVKGLARWDGAAWSALGSGVDSFVDALLVHTIGGETSLFAGGAFLTAGGVPGTAKIARWTGSAWKALGTGVAIPPNTSRVRDLVAHDADCSAATEAEIFAAGKFAKMGTLTVNNIARWNGGAWSALGTGVVGEVFALASLPDPDGGCPTLFVGGAITSAGGTPVTKLARWNGAQWSPAGTFDGDQITALRVVDEGEGPVLYAFGNFSTVDGQPIQQLARYDGRSWGPARPTSIPIVAFEAVDVPAEVPGGPEVWFGGNWSFFDGMASDGVARLVPPSAGPTVLAAPGDLDLSTGDALVLSVDAVDRHPLAGPLIHQWRRNGVPLRDGSGQGTSGPHGGDHGSIGTIVGSDSPTLIISPACIADSGLYDVVVTSFCGEVVAGPATVVVTTAADFDANGAVDSVDLGILLAGWGTSSTVADLDGDGVVGPDDLGLLLCDWTGG